MAVNGAATSSPMEGVKPWMKREADVYGIASWKSAGDLFAKISDARKKEAEAAEAPKKPEPKKVEPVKKAEPEPEPAEEEEAEEAAETPGVSVNVSPVPVIVNVSPTQAAAPVSLPDPYAFRVAGRVSEWVQAAVCGAALWALVGRQIIALVGA